MPVKQRRAEYHWFFVRLEPSTGALPAQITLADTGLTHHLKTVMRMKPGSRMVVVNEPEAQPYLASLDELSSKSLTLTLLERLPSPAPTTPMIAAISMIKGQRWDWALQKLTELGVTEIIPLKTRHTVVDVANPQAKLARWGEILRHAAEQSERVTIPVLHLPTPPEDLLKEPSYPEDSLKLLADEQSQRSLSQVLLPGATPSAVVFAIGPEGGWAPEERELLTSGGFQPVGLGDTILRSETAAVSLASVIAYATRHH